MTRSLLDDPDLDKAMREAAQKAVSETFALGLPVTRDVDGVVSRVYPDGRVEPVESARPSAARKLAA
jgi:hypothetical protein